MKCDQGYRCSVCGRDVVDITESDLYLHYVMGEVPLERLHLKADCHIACNPPVAQFIVDPAFSPVCCTGPFAKETLDTDYVREQEARVTLAWRRLQMLPGLGLPITEYPVTR